VDGQWHEQQDQARASVGNAVAMQEASAVGVVQRDFAPEIPEGLGGMRCPPVTSPHNMQDPEETNMVDPIEAMLTRDEQDVAWFSESWEDATLWNLCNLLH
jgi:hypothetical protein